MNKQVLDKSLRFIDSWLQFRYGQDEITGYAVAVAHKGKVVFDKAYGYANWEHKTKLTPEHIFRVASHSKTFTATALMQLQERGKLRIDDRVVDYLPWLKEHKDERWQHVTLRQLMSHGAGVIRDGLDADYWQLERPFPDKSELQRETLEADLVLENNIKLKYSNFGYGLLGLVVEAVSGEPYNAYVTKHIVKKLDLKNTGPEYTAAIDAALATGYTGREVDKTRLPITHVDTRALSPATGFYSTAADLCRYFHAHLLGTKKLLSDESKKEMQRVQYHAHTPGEDDYEDYGLGMELRYAGQRNTIGHSGGFPGFITRSMANPQDELVVVVLTNCIGGPATAIAKGIFGVFDYFQQNLPATKPKHDLSKLEGRYINLWSMTDIVVTGDKVVASYPDTWQPLIQPEPLERVDDTTLKVLETNSFYSEGELVHFKFKNGEVETVNYNGMTMWPEDTWRRKQQSRKQVE